MRSRRSLLAALLAACFADAGPATAAQPGTPGNAPLDCVVRRCAVEPVFDQWQEAERLRYGYGMTGDAALAAKWYRRSAEAGDPRAMHNYGLMLLRGEGVGADPEAAKEWLARAMAGGIAEAAFALGQLARQGGGDAARDPARARAYFLFGAEAGESRAMHALANMHAAGLGGPQSLEQAFFWYSIAAARGHPMAQRARSVAALRLPDRVRRETERRAEDWIQGTRARPPGGAAGPGRVGGGSP